MLSVKSVNLMSHPSFKAKADYEDINYEKIEDYSEDSFNNDKSKLEKQLDDLSAVIENQSVPKPVRVLGKLASIGIGAGVGMLSLKYGYQGTSKVVKKGFAVMKNLLDNPLTAKVTKAIAEPVNYFAGVLKKGAVNLYNKATQAISNSNFYNKAMASLNSNAEKFAGTVAGEKLTAAQEFVTEKAAKAGKVIRDSKPAEYVSKQTGALKDYIKNITPEKINKGVENLFTVSGGVTGGVTALQGVTAEGKK